MITAAERITFIITRGVIALALVVAGMFCIGRGIGFWSLPREESSQLGLDVLGLHINAGGLGGVIFGAGIAICFFAYKTAPRGLESRSRESVDVPPQNRDTGNAGGGAGRPGERDERPERGSGGGGGIQGGAPTYREYSDKVYSERPPSDLFKTHT